MTEKRNAVAEHLTFSQRYGYEPLPEPIRLEHISEDLRREIWNTIRELLLRKEQYNDFSGSYFNEQDSRFIERVIGKFQRRPEDEISTNYEGTLAYFRNVVFRENFKKILDLVEIIANDRDATKQFTEQIKNLFERYAAYVLDTSRSPFQFFPRSSKEQGEATQKAIETIRESGMTGAATHFRQAAEHIKARQYGDSIADSIHAVESVARIVSPQSSKTLTPALDSLEHAGLLKHSALKQGFEKLYGYTSDEQGIRHALLDKDSPDVGLDEAVFMFGACASFAAYLVDEHRQMNQEQNGAQ